MTEIREETPTSLTVSVKGGEKLYLSGSITHEQMWLEPRKWWQFWLPRYVEKYRAWEDRPTSAKPPSASHTKSAS